jgi:hypothetical protein
MEVLQIKYPLTKLMHIRSHSYVSIAFASHHADCSWLKKSDGSDVVGDWCLNTLTVDRMTCSALFIWLCNPMLDIVISHFSILYPQLSIVLHCRRMEIIATVLRDEAVRENEYEGMVL